MWTLAKRLFNIHLTLWSNNLSPEWIFNEKLLPYKFLMYPKLIYVINLYRKAYKKWFKIILKIPLIALIEAT